jgi:hypothetical protein
MHVLGMVFEIGKSPQSDNFHFMLLGSHLLTTLINV